MKTLLPRRPVARARMLGVWLQRRAEVSQLQGASCRYIILGSSSVTLRHPGVVRRTERTFAKFKVPQSWRGSLYCFHYIAP